MTSSQSLLRDAPRLICLFTVVISGLLPSSPAFARDYFISPRGDDRQAGTQKQPWRSIGKINHYHFKPGDNIYFERGGIWREPLVIPTSGTRGNFISYGAYPDKAAQARPVISCARDISDILWPGIIANGGFEDLPATGRCPGSIPGWTIRSSSGHRCTVEASGKGNALVLKNLGGNTDLLTNEFNLRAGGHYSLEGSIKAVDSATVHVYVYSNGKQNRYLSGNQQGRGSWKEMTRNSPRPLFTTSNSNWTTFHIPFTTETALTTRIRISVRNKNASAWIDNIKLRDLDTNYWSANTINVHNPRILLRNGIRLSKSTEWSGSGRWHIATGGQKTARYIPASDRPDARLEIGNHRTGILLDNKSWIRISNLEIEACEAPRNDALEGAGILLIHGSSNNIFSGLLLTNNAHGFRAQGKGKDGDFNSDNIIENMEVAYGLDQGIALRSEASRNIIRNSTVHDLNTVASDHDMRDKEGISLGGNTGTGPGNIVDHNEVYNIGTDARGSLGIVAFNSPDTIIRNNHVHDIGANGIGIGSNGKSPAGFRSDNTWIYSNLVVRTGISRKAIPGQGIHIMVSDYGDIRGTRIYNNTVVDCELNDSKDGGISLRGVANPDGTVNSIQDARIFNNIVSDCHGRHPSALFIGDPGIVKIERLQSDNNLFYSSPAGGKKQILIDYMGKTYKTDQFKEYRRYSGLDSSSIISNPLFRDSANNDFRLQPDSPAIHAGRKVATPSSPDGENAAVNPDIGAL